MRYEPEIWTFPEVMDIITSETKNIGSRSSRFSPRCQTDACAQATVEGRPFRDSHTKKEYTPMNLEWYRL